MALRLQPTLADMLSEVLTGLNLGAAGPTNVELHPLIQRKLRDAQAFLWARHPWLQNRIRIAIDLVDGQTDYEFPDAFDPGSIRMVTCVSNRTTTHTEWPVHGGVELEDRNIDAILPVSTLTGIPYRYQFMDQVIRVQPAPTGDDPPTMFLELESGVVPLVEPDERPAVDGRACVMLATILVKEDRRMPVGETERGILTSYIDAQRGKQTEPQVFTLGTDYRHPNDYGSGHWRRLQPYNRDGWRPS